MLEVLANNLANLNTTGFKGDETFFRLYNRAVSESGLPPLDQAINDSTVVQGTVVNFQGGPMTATGRDLDAALEGAGFFVVETPAGTRYTRNGHFQVNSQGRLVTSEGFASYGEERGHYAASRQSEHCAERGNRSEWNCSRFPQDCGHCRQDTTTEGGQFDVSG